jgi:synaptobrevin family protein YKT6
MKVLIIMIFRTMGDEKTPILLCSAEKLDEFSFFQRGTIREHLQFGCRTICQRTRPQQRLRVDMKDNPYIVHTFVRNDGLGGAVITDAEYPERAAQAFLKKSTDDVDRSTRGNWNRVVADQEQTPGFLAADITAFQDPAGVDKLTRIQRELDQTTQIMRQNIDEVLKRGETLDDLMAKSDDLSATSVQFYKKAKDQNACCTIL